MFCPRCGGRNDDTAWHCVRCGGALRGAAPQPAPQSAPQPPVPLPHVPSYMARAILATLFCCLPLGIVGIVYAAQVNGRLAAGDYTGAQLASRSARGWSNAAIVISVLVGAVLVVMGILAEEM